MSIPHLFSYTTLLIFFVLLSCPSWAQLSAAAKGQEVHQLYCSPCHGPRGEGNGSLAAKLQPPPTNFTDKKQISTLTDDHLVELITKGGGPVHASPIMPSWAPILRPEDVRNVVTYIRTLSRK